MKSWCVGGRPYSETENPTRCLKINPEKGKIVIFNKGTREKCERNKSQFLTFK